MSAVLCVIPGCRIRNRHLPSCVDDCLGCLPRQATDGNTCDVCDARTRERLDAIAELADDARAVARGEIRRGGGGSSGKPGSRPPLNDGATDALDAVTNALTTIARDIAETRGLHVAVDASTPADPLAQVCSWLSGQLGWVRHAVDDQGQPYAIRFSAEVAECASRMRGLVNGPAPQRYLGPCGADTQLDIGTYDEPDRTMDGPPCDGDVYAREGAQRGRCDLCGAEVSTDLRRAWLDAEARSHAFRAVHIAEAYRINVNTIRSWALRGLLKSFWRTEAGLVTPWVETGDEAEIKARGGRLHYVGDVLDLAASEAARRAGEQAKRARRAAAKVAEDERMSA